MTWPVLGLVMGRYALIKDLGGEMAVIDPSPAIMRIFKLAGMDRLIRIERTSGETVPDRAADNEKEEGSDIR